jgi:hypothetical protein
VTADISLRFFPVDELCFSRFDLPFAFAQFFFVPCGRLDRCGVSRQTLPKRFHGLQLLFNGHFV